MRKIINGRVYDTATATQLALHDAGIPIGRPDYWSETLYQTKSRAYFLHTAGGPESRYAVRDGAGWTSSESIIPMTIEQVNEWFGKASIESAEILTERDESRKEKLNIYISVGAKEKLCKRQTRPDLS